MATNTINYHLNKPDATDFYDISVFNGNADKIDTTMKSIENIGSLNATKVDAALGMGVRTVSASKSGTVFHLNGEIPNAGAISCVFKAPSDYVQGNTFTVNNEAQNIVASDGEPLLDRAFVSGAMVSVVLDRASRTINFKSAGGVKLPAGTMAIYKIFTANGTFVAPKTGKYRFTCIGKGGNGGISNTNSSGGGGGAGGVSCCVFTANTGHTLSITVDSGKSAVGIIMAATAGENGAANGGQGAGGYGTGGITYNITGGGGNGFYGGCYSTAAAASCKYISETYAGFDYTPDSYTHGRTLTKPNANGLIPYGNGGSGGKQYVDPDQNATHGGIGSPGAVIIEMELNA